VEGVILVGLRISAGAALGVVDSSWDLTNDMAAMPSSVKSSVIATNFVIRIAASRREGGDAMGAKTGR
jgi:hypothetical protein